MKPLPPPAQPMTDPPLPAASPPWVRVPEKPLSERVKNALLVVALALLAISIAIAYYSANSIVSIWFERQWAPVARLVLALLVAAVAGWAVVRLTRKR